VNRGCELETLRRFEPSPIMQTMYMRRSLFSDLVRKFPDEWKLYEREDALEGRAVATPHTCKLVSIRRKLNRVAQRFRSKHRSHYHHAFDVMFSHFKHAVVQVAGSTALDLRGSATDVAPSSSFVVVSMYLRTRLLCL